MYFLHRFAVLLVYFVSTNDGCRGPNQRSEGRIIGGELAKGGQFPYMVSVNKNGGHWCGGCIIDREWVLTAAHCVAKEPNATYKIIVGTNSRSGRGGTTYKTSKIIMHNYDYTIGLPDNDIALMKVTPPFEYTEKIKPIPLNTEYIPGRREIVEIGWGYTAPNSSTREDSLQYLLTESIDNPTCQKTWHYNIKTTHLCTYKFGKATCNGDSGGPLVTGGKVAGIVSWGAPTCATPKVPDVNTRVSEYIDYIQTTMANN